MKWVAMTPLVEDILLEVAKTLRLPSEMPQVEQLEIALDRLCESYDSALPADEDAPAGEPLTAEAIQAALKLISNPDISSTYAAPPTVTSELDSDEWLDFDQLFSANPDNFMLSRVEKLGEPIAKRAAELVFNNLNTNLWNDKEVVEKCMTQMILQLGQASKNID